MSIAILARNRAIVKGVPAAFVAFNRQLSNSHSSSPLLESGSVSKQLNSPIDPSDRLNDPNYRFRRTIPVNWGIVAVPQDKAFVIERFGKFSKVLEAGIHVLVPFVDRIAYVHSLKTQTIEVAEQPAITTDNVVVRVKGLLYVEVIDPERASYSHDNAMTAVIQLAQAVTRSAIGKMPLDKIFMESETLNANIVVCTLPLYVSLSVGDVMLPARVTQTLFLQAIAELKRRAHIIEAERKSRIVILTSEAAKLNSINRAAGEAEAIRIIGESIQGTGGQAASLNMLLQDYVQAFNKMAKESTTLLLHAPLGVPSNASRQIEHDSEVDSAEKPSLSLQTLKK